MKNVFLKNCLNTLGLMAIVCAISPQTSAETNTVPATTNLPIVTVAATDFSASESGPDTGTFTVRRSGGTNVSVTVFFQLSGGASNGVDYQVLPNNVVIPVGALTAPVVVTPIDDTLIEVNESVVLILTPSPLDSLPQYAIGMPNRAELTIADNDRPKETNLPPVVHIDSPAPNSVFAEPADISIFASAYDPDGSVTRLEFFEGTHSLGITTNNPLVLSPINPFHVSWTNVLAGNYVLTARATDNKGSVSTSEPVRISVSGQDARAIVNIVATDRDGAEIPVVPPGMDRPQLYDPAIFTVWRTGATGTPLNVYYSIGGSAWNGVDYATLPRAVTIPAGAFAATIEVAPIDDFIVEDTETVIITLESPMCIAIVPPPPDCYLVGPSNRATVFIHDNDITRSNLPPAVRITSPAEGLVFPAPGKIAIEAVAVDPDGYCSKMEFFAGTNKIGETVLNFIQAPPPGQPIVFSFNWINVPVGNYVLTARATDDLGAIGSSSPVRVAVTETNRPLGSNLPPVVTIMASDSVASEGTNFWFWPYWDSDGEWKTNASPANVPGLIFSAPNTAAFKVQRSGGVDLPLTVNYSISGTASNGVDYETLSGAVTIPVGERTAKIMINPMDDLLPEPLETVVLALLAPPPAGATTLPSYVVGFPRNAAAVIVDNDQPRPPCLNLPDGIMHICRPATNGFCYRLEASSNLVEWTAICTNRVTDGAMHFVDPETKDTTHRFYRMLPEANPPQE